MPIVGKNLFVLSKNHKVIIKYMGNRIALKGKKEEVTA